MSILDFCRNETQMPCKYLFLGQLCGNSTVSLAFDSESIYKYSCDWLYLIDSYLHYSPTLGIYTQLLNVFQNCRSVEGIRIPGRSVLVSTSFSSGTVHGYIGILEILLSLNGSYDTYVVHQNAQNGIKDLIELAVPSEKIYYILPDTLYAFDDLTLIPVRTHSIHFSESEKGLIRPITDFVHRLLFDSKESPLSETVVVLKSSTSANLTGDGIFPYNTIVEFCDQKAWTRVEPIDHKEDEYARIIHGSKRLVISFGTTWMKAMLYVSDRCEQIDVVIIGLVYQEQYNAFQGTHAAFPSQYKNARITYHTSLDTVV